MSSILEYTTVRSSLLEMSTQALIEFIACAVNMFS